MASKSVFSKTSRNQGPSQDASLPGASIDEPGLVETGNYMKTALAGFIAARAELASIEAKEAAEFAARKVIHGVILAISGFFIWALVLAGLAGVLAPMANQWLAGKVDWLPGWAAVLFALAILHGIVAIISLICLKKKPATPLFELSRQEIENDKQWLKENKQ